MSLFLAHREPVSDAARRGPPGPPPRTEKRYWHAEKNQYAVRSMKENGKISIVDDQRKTRLHKKLAAELGPVIGAALADDAVLEVMLNADGQIWVERLGGVMEVVGEMTEPNSLSLAGTIADSLNTVVTPESPVIEGELVLDGSRVEVIIPPVVTRTTMTIRKRALLVFSLKDYVEKGIMTEPQRREIMAAIEDKLNILVVGGTGTGKTTLVNAVIQAVSESHPDDRLVIIEDTRELQPVAKNCVQLRTSPECDMNRLLRATLRMRPDRIIVGEVRGGEALDLLKAWNTGHPGGVSTVHANDANAGLLRVEQLVAEAGLTKGARGLIAEAVGLIIVISRVSGERRISEVMRVEKSSAGGYQTTESKEHDE